MIFLLKNHACAFTNGSQIKQFIRLCAVCDPTENRTQITSLKS